MPINNILKDAGQLRRIVKITIVNKFKQTEILEVEPYGKQVKNKVTLLFCLDTASFAYLDIPTTSITTAEITSKPFKPRVPITL